MRYFFGIRSAANLAAGFYFVIFSCFSLKAQTVSTFAGTGAQGSTDGLGASATFNGPNGIALDASGNLFVSDGNRIRKITTDGTVSTFAGSGNLGSTDGSGSSATFYFPEGVATDASGNIWIADQMNHKIRKITPEGIVSTFATGIGAPSGIAFDASGTIYIADFGNHKIRKITSSGIWSTLAGSGIAGSDDGTGTSASFNFPKGIALDASGNVYVADWANNKIRKITPDGIVSTLAGSGEASSIDGEAGSASFNRPAGIAVDAGGNVFVSERTGNKIRKITPAGAVSTVAGNGSSGNTDGLGTSASFNLPEEIAVDASGNIYVADKGNRKIRKISNVVTAIDREVETTNFLIYPNPVKHTLCLSNTLPGSFYEVTDVYGTRLLMGTLNDNSIVVSGLSSGIFFIKIQTTKGTCIKKFVKE